MKTRKVFSMMVMLLFAVVAMAQMQMPPIPVDKDVRIGKLDNGLTYYIRYNNWPENRAEFYIAHCPRRGTHRCEYARYEGAGSEYHQTLVYRHQALATWWHEGDARVGGDCSRQGYWFVDYQCSRKQHRS